MSSILCVNGDKRAYPGHERMYLLCNFGEYVLMTCPRGTMYCPRIDTCCFQAIQRRRKAVTPTPRSPARYIWPLQGLTAKKGERNGSVNVPLRHPSVNAEGLNDAYRHKLLELFRRFLKPGRPAMNSAIDGQRKEKPATDRSYKELVPRKEVEAIIQRVSTTHSPSTELLEPTTPPAVLRATAERLPVDKRTTSHGSSVIGGGEQGQIDGGGHSSVGAGSKQPLVSKESYGVRYHGHGRDAGQGSRDSRVVAYINNPIRSPKTNDKRVRTYHGKGEREDRNRPELSNPVVDIVNENKGNVVLRTLQDDEKTKGTGANSSTNLLFGSASLKSISYGYGVKYNPVRVDQLENTTGGKRDNHGLDRNPDSAVSGADLIKKPKPTADGVTQKMGLTKINNDLTINETYHIPNATGHDNGNKMDPDLEMKPGTQESERKSGSSPFNRQSHAGKLAAWGFRGSPDKRRAFKELRDDSANSWTEYLEVLHTPKTFGILSTPTSYAVPDKQTEEENQMNTIKNEDETGSRRISAENDTSSIIKPKSTSTYPENSRNRYRISDGRKRPISDKSNNDSERQNTYKEMNNNNNNNNKSRLLNPRVVSTKDGSVQIVLSRQILFQLLRPAVSQEHDQRLNIPPINISIIFE